MVIKSDYNESSMLEELLRTQELGYDRLFSELVSIASEFVSEAKAQPEGHAYGFYDNRTMKLRQSIGAYIFRNGELVWSMVEGNGDENLALVLNDDGKIVSQGFTVVGIAGMDYAGWVEAKGYNVISTQWDTLIVDLNIIKTSKQW